MVAAPTAEVWERVVTPEGINHEMLPWLTMRMPRSARELTVDAVRVGEVLGRAWLFLFGVLPVDYDRLAIVELEPGRYFHERSTMLSMRRWEHQRTLAPVDEATTRVTDRITLEPRLSLLAPIAARLVAAFFGHRHRRLRRHFDQRSRRI